MGELGAALRAVREAGARSFVPYVTGGFPGVDGALLRSLQDAGADAIEVGIPHSDPIMDGGVIQEASRVALEAGAHPADVLRAVAEARLDVPVAAMTYVNPVLRRGAERFCDDLVGAGVSGLIVPDLPVDEAGEIQRVAAARDIGVVLLAAPGTSTARYAAIGSASRGFVYCVATYGVTGARDSLAGTAGELVARLRPVTDLPLLIGVGVGSPDQAAKAGSFADGVIVGSALMRRLVEGDRDGMLRLAAAFRTVLPVA